MGRKRKRHSGNDRTPVRKTTERAPPQHPTSNPHNAGSDPLLWGFTSRGLTLCYGVGHDYQEIEASTQYPTPASDPHNAGSDPLLWGFTSRGLTLCYGGWPRLPGNCERLFDCFAGFYNDRRRVDAVGWTKLGLDAYPAGIAVVNRPLGEARTKREFTVAP